MQHSNTAGCILLKFYIKPQHTANVYNLLYVVSYRNSTSNHNEGYDEMKELYVVSYRNSTSNHNKLCFEYFFIPLYLIEILHQTTTTMTPWNTNSKLYLIEILHQTTTKRSRTRDRGRCILSKFYIKPQRLCRCSSWPSGCILSKFYIKPQQSCRSIPP